MAEADHDHLEAPPKTSTEDPGAHDLESSDSDDHFSDAQSGLDSASEIDPPPIPHTRVEKVDDEPSYGEEPGTEAYRLREQDAAPDEIDIISESKRSASASSGGSTLPGGQPIPTTVVEKVDPSSPSHGEVPGTLAHELRAADSVPDLVVRVGGDRSRSPSIRSRSGSTPGDLPIPITKVERVDDKPSHGEVPGTMAYELRKKDAEPDILEQVEDAAGKGISARHISEPMTESESPTLPTSRSPTINHARRKSSAAGKKGPPAVANDYDENEDGSDGGFGDDFDDFEEGEEDAEFGDFDDGFQEAAPAPAPAQFIPYKLSFPVLDFDDLASPDEVLEATEPYLNALFPPDTIDTSVLPPVSVENSIFLTPRSASLWSQLVAPPPLQPPNWIRSRIRRLFLVSLGVPVDLDEILPASKQKKLILPSMNLSTSSSSPRNSSSISRLKQGEGNASSTSVDSQGKPSRSDSRRRKGPPPAPQLDLVWARQLCTITDEALNGLSVEELKNHVKKLEDMQGAAEEVLSYWTKRTDEKLGDREAFEGVIENLVKHARKTRK